MRTAYIVQRKGTNTDALALHFLPPLFTTMEKKLGQLNIQLTKKKKKKEKRKKQNDKG